MGSEPKILFWDLETTGFRADWGEILCMGYKWAHKKKTHLLTIEQHGGIDKFDLVDDSGLVRECKKVLEEADVWVTWYGTWFDVPYMNTRLAVHGIDALPSPPLVKHVDGWKTCKKKYKLSNNRLDTIARMLSCPVEKSWVDPQIWKKAGRLHKPSLKYIYDHCRKDIEVLEYVYDNAIKALATEIPGMGLGQRVDRPNACPRCGVENRLQARGFGFNKLTRYRRFQCQACGGWCRGANLRPTVASGEPRTELRS